MSLGKYVIAGLFLLVPALDITAGEAEPPAALVERYYQSYQLDRARGELNKIEKAFRRKRQKPPIDLALWQERLSLAERSLATADSVVLLGRQSIPIGAGEVRLPIPRHLGEISIKAERDSTGLISIETLYTDARKAFRLASNRQQTGRLEAYSRSGEAWARVPIDIKDFSQQGHLEGATSTTDGLGLYFATPSEESLGGDDLFFSRYDLERACYFKPTQLGIPFNSPQEDLLLVQDKERDLYYLLTDRNAGEGLLNLYCLRLVESPDGVSPENALLQGDIVAEKGSSIWLEGESEEMSDVFFFAVGDRVLRTEADFRDRQALKIYKDWQTISGQLALLQERLDKLRQSYHEASAAERGVLAPEILNLEGEIIVERNQVRSMEIEIRNLESKYSK